jgi:hypothetical protein
VIWVYAVCEQPERPLPAVSGLGGAPLVGIADGPLLAVATRHHDVPDDAGVDALWTHQRVIEAVGLERAVVPVRFASRHGDAEHVRAALAERRDALLAALERVRGRVEVAVRVIEPEPAPVDGRTYLARRRKAAALHDRLAQRAIAAGRRPEHGGQELLRGAYLVERPAVAAFTAFVQALQREHPEVSLVCTGPWPAYSFVTGLG